MNSENLCPRNKSDIARVNALIAAGPKAAEHILEDLLCWLQDINWPVAAPLADFLVQVGEPLIPHLRKILESNDDMWIYWVLQYVVAKLPKELIRELNVQLQNFAGRSENDLIAIRIAAYADIWDKKTLKWMIDNHISAYEEHLIELKELRTKIVLSDDN